MLFNSATIFGLALGVATLSGQGSRPLTTKQAASDAGQLATVCGKIVTFGCAQEDRTTRFNLDSPSWGRERGFAIAIPSSVRSKFGGDPEGRYHGHSVCVSGTIVKEGKAQRIDVTDPGQITITDAPDEPQSIDSRRHRACEEGVTAPRLLKGVGPLYSHSGFTNRISGSALLEAVVGVDGNVRDVRVLYSLDQKSGMDDQALESIRKWRFEPGTYRGQPAEVSITVQTSFSIRH